MFKFKCLICLSLFVESRFSLAHQVYVRHKVKSSSFALAAALLSCAAVPATSCHLRLRTVLWCTGRGLSWQHQCMAPGPLAVEALTYTQWCWAQVHFKRKTQFAASYIRLKKIQQIRETETACWDTVCEYRAKTNEQHSWKMYFDFKVTKITIWSTYTNS